MNKDELGRMKDEIGVLASQRDGVSLPRVMRGEVMVKTAGIEKDNE
jgi:hypothetical protein